MRVTKGFGLSDNIHRSTEIERVCDGAGTSAGIDAFAYEHDSNELRDEKEPRRLIEACLETDQLDLALVAADRVRSIALPSEHEKITHSIDSWGKGRSQAEGALSGRKPFRFNRNLNRVLGMGRREFPYRWIMIGENSVVLKRGLRVHELRQVDVVSSEIAESRAVYSRDDRFEYEYPVRKLQVETRRRTYSVDTTRHGGAYPYADLLEQAIIDRLDLQPSITRDTRDPWSRHWSRQIMTLSAVFWACMLIGIVGLAASKTIALVAIGLTFVGWLFVVIYPAWRLLLVRRETVE